MNLSLLRDRTMVRGLGFVLLALVVGRGRAALAQAPEESVGVFRQMKPSVVALRNAEGGGTGIILQRDGTVLTNAHVVSSPLPYEVTIDVDTPDGAGKQVTFKRVEILGLHKRLDLALVRIDAAELKAAGVALKPAVVQTTKAEPGQRVYVIGNPGGGGQVLNKSISSGMVSGVDREIEGERYYQTDAAINPGNSGGPMCNRAGQVIGLVTFKFTDVQAIGFAIPLHDLDFKEFVPLSQRRGDRKQADEMLKRAEQYSGRRDKALKARRGNNDDPEVQMWTYYAAMCYRQALSHDPSNPDVYYMVGMLLRSLDQDDVAAAYLARSIQLAPLQDSAYKGYRELGFALAKQKKDAEAVAAWREGVAKYPYDPVLWDDMAIWNIQQKNYLEAARCASAFLLVAEEGNRRRATVTKLMADAVTQLNIAGKTAEAEKALKETEIAAMLDGLLARANAWRAQRTPCYTKEFADLMLQFGGYAVPGVEKDIPVEPLVRHAAVERISAEPIVRGAVPPAPKFALAAASTTASNPDWASTIRMETSGGGGGGAATPAGSTATNTKPPAAPSGTAGGDWLNSQPPAAPPAAGTGDAGKTTQKPPAAPGVVDFIAGPGKAAASAMKVPQPTATGRDVAAAARQVTDAKARLVSATGVVGMEWSTAPDAPHAFILQGDGILRKVAVPSMKEERQLALGSRCLGMARCSQGLAVMVQTAQEIWIIDQDLVVRRRAAAPGAMRMTASAALPLLFYVGGAASDEQLTVIDLDAAKSMPVVRPRDLVDVRSLPKGAPMLGFRSVAATPDGKFLLCEGGEALHRLRIEAAKLVADERGPRIAPAPLGVTVSPDGRYVALPCGTGNVPIPPAVKVEPFATYVFKVEDLRTPVMTLKGTAYPKAIGFDPAAKSLYGQSIGRQLVVFAPDGSRAKDYTLSAKRDAATVRFLVHPQGKSLFVQTDADLNWVTLP